MTKKGKIIAGIIGGVLVLGGIGCAVDGKDKKPETSIIFPGSSKVQKQGDESITGQAETSTSDIRESSDTTISAIIVTSASKLISEPVINSASTIESVYSTVTEPVSVTEVTPATAPQSAPTITPEPSVVQPETYVLNTRRKKVHKSTCRDVNKISNENLGSATSAELDSYIAAGYTACGHCHPF